MWYFSNLQVLYYLLETISMRQVDTIKYFMSKIVRLNSLKGFHRVQHQYWIYFVYK